MSLHLSSCHMAHMTSSFYAPVKVFCANFTHSSRIQPFVDNLSALTPYEPKPRVSQDLQL